jgi:uncharacterized protein YggT (Ycf19 family)
MDLGRVASAILYFITGIVEVLIIFRIILMLFAADNTAQFTVWLYSSTDPLVAPFQGVFPTINLGNVITFEISSALALIVYGVAALVLVQLIRMFDGLMVRPVKTQPLTYQQAPVQTMVPTPIQQMPTVPFQPTASIPQQVQVPSMQGVPQAPQVNQEAQMPQYGTPTQQTNPQANQSPVIPGNPPYPNQPQQ